MRCSATDGGGSFCERVFNMRFDFGLAVCINQRANLSDPFVLPSATFIDLTRSTKASTKSINPALHQKSVSTDTCLSRIPEFTQHRSIHRRIEIRIVEYDTNGALPPSSNESFFTLSAHWRYKILPTCVDPVKVTFRTLLLQLKPLLCPVHPFQSHS